MDMRSQTAPTKLDLLKVFMSWFSRQSGGDQRAGKSRRSSVSRMNERAKEANDKVYKHTASLSNIQDCASSVDGGATSNHLILPPDGNRLPRRPISSYNVCMSQFTSRPRSRGDTQQASSAISPRPRQIRKSLTNMDLGGYAHLSSEQMSRSGQEANSGFLSKLAFKQGTAAA